MEFLLGGLAAALRRGPAGPGHRNPQPVVKDRSTRFFENSFINKTYHHVRSFGKDLSNLQKFQDAHQAYGDITGNVGKVSQP